MKKPKAARISSVTESKPGEGTVCDRPNREAFAAALHAGQRALDVGVSSALDDAQQALKSGRPLDAVDRIVDLFDDLLHASEFERTKRLFAQIDPRGWPPQVLTGVLTTRPAREVLGDARHSFMERASDALREVWSFTPEQVAGVRMRLA